MTQKLPLILAGLAACTLSTQAHADVPKAQIRGEVDGDLRRMLERAIGQVDNPPANRFEARRYARSAVQVATDLLRSEGYYQAQVEDEVESSPERRLAAAPLSAPTPQAASAARSADAAMLQGFDQDFLNSFDPEFLNGLDNNFTAGKTTAPADLNGTPDESSPTRLAPTAAPPPAPLAETANDGPPVAVILVTPGRQFMLDEAKVNWTAPAPDSETIGQVTEGIQLKPGAPGRAADIIAAEGRIIATLTRQGYADAKTEPRRVVVDHADFTVQPNFNIASGALVLMDGIRLRTFGSTDENWVSSLAPWEKGDRFDPEDVAELERRLIDTGVYENVAVALSPVEQTDANGQRPVIVSLTDRARKVLEAGATYATTDGVGVDVFRTRYNRLNRADTLRYGLRYASIDSRIGGELSLPHWRRPGRTLKLSSWLVNEQTDAYDRNALTINADLSQRIGKTSYFSYGLGIDAGQYKENRFDPITQNPITFDRNLAILTARGAAYMDRSNDPLNPTTGYRLDVSVQPTAVTGEDNVFFLRSIGTATAYLPVQDQAKTVLAGRLRIGSILGGQELTVPSDRLFYSGGGGSVRGYSFQSINPRWPDNTPRGGLSLFETSVEVRRDIGEKFQAVAFVDAGAIGFQETPNLTNMRYGAGVGVRYKLPFGPVRADIAVPLNARDGDSDFQLYLSIGQAF